MWGFPYLVHKFLGTQRFYHGRIYIHQTRIPNLVDGLESGILSFINILVKLCIYPFIFNHMIWIALFGIQESLESSQEPWNQARNLGILPRFQKIPNHVEENS